MTDSIERDELAELVRNGYEPLTLGGYDVADAILAAGFRRKVGGADD